MKKKYLYLFLASISFYAHAGSMGVLRDRPWDSYYIGGNLGATWGLLHNHLTINNSSVNPLFFSPVIAEVNTSGSNLLNPLRFTGGAQGGVNKELTNHVVVGLELSYDYINLNQSVHRTNPYVNSPSLHFYSIDNKASATQLGTLRARLGYDYYPFLPYVTGGGALTNLSYKETFTDHQYGITNTTEFNKVRVGWVVGAGLEYFPLKQASFKIEYLYAGFPNAQITSQFLGTGALTGLSAVVNNTLNNIAVQTLLVGINWHFV